MASTAEQDRIQVLQRTLYRAAKADPKRRFHALYDKVYRRDVLERAWSNVRHNAGAAGIDRTTIADVERYGVDLLLDELAAQLRAGTYRPLPRAACLYRQARVKRQASPFDSRRSRPDRASGCEDRPRAAVRG